MKLLKEDRTPVDITTSARLKDISSDLTWILNATKYYENSQSYSNHAMSVKVLTNI